LNEVTTLNEKFVKEVQSRCSYAGAQIIMDTNPEHQNHYVKKDLIDKGKTYLSSGNLNTVNFHFTLFDNIFLDKDYVESIIANTPKGHYTDRDIHGLWVNATGTIYDNFEINEFDIDKIYRRDCIRLLGLDFGWNDPTALVDIVVNNRERLIYINQEIYSSKLSNDMLLNKIYDLGLERETIIADSANPKDIEDLYINGLSYIEGVKKRKITLGIRKILGYKIIIHPRCENFINEINNYCWHETKPDEPNDKDNHLINNVKSHASVKYKSGKKSGKLKCQSDLKLVA
jgi:PBSX family phage terminase large subunit